MAIDLDWLEVPLKFLFDLLESIKDYFFVNYRAKTWDEVHDSPSPNRPAAHPPRRYRKAMRKRPGTAGAAEPPTVYVRPPTPLERIPSAVLPPVTTPDGLAPPPEEHAIKKARMTAEQFNARQGPIEPRNGPKLAGNGSQGSLARDEYLKHMTMKVDYKRRSVAQWGQVKSADSASETSSGGAEVGPA